MQSGVCAGTTSHLERLETMECVDEFQDTSKQDHHMFDKQKVFVQTCTLFAKFTYVKMQILISIDTSLANHKHLEVFKLENIYITYSHYPRSIQGCRLSSKCHTLHPWQNPSAPVAKNVLLYHVSHIQDDPGTVDTVHIPLVP